jgi:hypothetical protein
MHKVVFKRGYMLYKFKINWLMLWPCLNIMTVSCAPRQQVQQSAPAPAAKAPCICVKNFDPVCHLPSQQTFGNQCEALCDATHRPEELKPGPCAED